MIIRLPVSGLDFFGVSRVTFVCFLVNAFLQSVKIFRRFSLLLTKTAISNGFNNIFLFFSTMVITFHIFKIIFTVSHKHKEISQKNLIYYKKLINSSGVSIIMINKFYRFTGISLVIYKQMYLLAIFIV